MYEIIGTYRFSIRWEAQATLNLILFLLSLYFADQKGCVLKVLCCSYSRYFISGGTTIWVIIHLAIDSVDSMMRENWLCSQVTSPLRSDLPSWFWQNVTTFCYDLRMVIPSYVDNHIRRSFKKVWCFISLHRMLWNSGAIYVR